MDCLLVFWESEVLYDGQADCYEDEAEVPHCLALLICASVVSLKQCCCSSNSHDQLVVQCVWMQVSKKEDPENEDPKT